MPELPEVQTIINTVKPHLVGRRIVKCTIDDPLLCQPDDPQRICRGLVGSSFTGVFRRGKYIICSLCGGQFAEVVFHLRMTGRLLVLEADETAVDRIRAEFALDTGCRLLFCDTRRLGKMSVAKPSTLMTMGPEPFSEQFLPHLHKQLRRRKAPIKAALLDQRVACGTGNIYADEALFAAQIHPLTPCRDLTDEQVVRLAHALEEVFRRSLAARGTTFSRYVDGRGVPGEFAHSLAVYGRKGQPCLRCGTIIDKIQVACRGTSYCPRCQVRGGPQ